MNEIKARICDEGEQLRISDQTFTVAQLSEWRNWQAVEKLLKATEYSDYELSVVAAFSKKCGRAGHNGWTETLQALQTQKYVKAA
jgi:hypothetical protein